MAPDRQDREEAAAPRVDEDLAAWLLADEDTYRARASSERPRSSTATPGSQPHPASLGVPSAPTADAKSVDAQSVDGQWSAVGGAFQPIAGGPLITRLPDSGNHPAGAAVVADVGALVHAVVPGVVARASDPMGGLSLNGDDRAVSYGGTAVVSWHAVDGSQVHAGAVLGVVTGPTDGDQPPQLHVIPASTQVLLDPVGWLSGLADPAELGMTTTGQLGPDPFLTDLRLAGHLEGPPT